MREISGTLKVGEANATVGALMARQHGSNASYYAIMLGLICAGLALGLLTSFVLAGENSPAYDVGGPVGVALGAGAFLLIRRPLMVARFRRKFQARQHTLELPHRVEVSVEHLTYEVGGVTQTARWSAVDELFRAHDYWVFLAQAHYMFAPRRYFADESEEKLFLKDALSHMSEDARARSAEAVRFVGDNLA